MTKIATSTLVIGLLSVSLAPWPAYGQGPPQKLKWFPLQGYDWAPESPCHDSKGRLQDQGPCQPKVMDQIIAAGTDAVPILISQIADARELKYPTFAFWNGRMTYGDLAAFILDDLFTDSDWQSFNMQGLEELRPKCESSAEQCWHRLIKQHGRKFVQDKWLAAWRANKDRVYWDMQARCFRLSPKAQAR
jgi:hypothetical protein